jgi:beta-galactosidase
MTKRFRRSKEAAGPSGHFPGQGRRPTLARLGYGALAFLVSVPTLGAVQQPRATEEAGVPQNLAQTARAVASESYQGLTPEKAADGDPATRWSGIPGHTAGVWFELDWSEPVRIAEVVIHQFDTYAAEIDVRVWDAVKADWRTVRHLGRPGAKLPKVIVVEFPAERTERLRLADISGGPSFNDVEAYAQALPRRLSVQAASDLNGDILGIVTDRWGSSPVAGARAAIHGRGERGDWQAAATTDEKGLFTIRMPLGLEGKVEAVVTDAVSPDKTLTATLLWDAADFQYGLTPRSYGSDVALLEGDWRFAPDPPDGFWKPGFEDTGWSDIAVPSHWEMRGFRSLDGVGGYRRWFSLPPGSGRLILRFDGVYSGAEVWVNGRRLACHEGGATPFEVDITEAVKPVRNLLAVRVTEHTRTSDLLDKMSQYADFPLAGIMRRVYLFRVPDAHIGALALSTRFEPGSADAAMTGRLAILNMAAGRLGDASVRFRLIGQDGADAPLEASPVRVTVGAWQRADVDFTVRAASPRPWEAEHPNLYHLIIELEAGGRVLQSLDQRVGFRETRVAGTQILINGQPVKFRGTCHHDAHPLMGRAVTPELARQDLRLMKEANLNAVRTSHYPPIPELLDAADELGLYVEDEAPFCWVGVSDDLNFTPRIIQLTAELVTRDRNHPSVFMWSLCNESGFGYGFARSHEWVRAADPDRPTGAATSAWLEIATLHNPIAVSRIEENEKLDKPLLFDESLCIFQGIFGDVAEMWVDPGVRDYYAAPLPAIYDRFMKSRVTQGSFIWCWADDIFCVSHRGLEYGRGATLCQFLTEQYAFMGRGLVGDAPWGVVDGWRRPKPEFWITKKLHSPVKIPERPLPLPAPGLPLRVPVENQYDFTDLSELKIAWNDGWEKGELRASVPPRSTGEIAVPIGRLAETGAVLELTFSHPNGLLVDAYRLPVGESPESVPPLRNAIPGPLVLRQEDRLAGVATHIIGRQFELAFDNESGRLRRGVAFGMPVLLELPSLHVLPTASPLAPLPDRLSWKLKTMAAKRDGEDVRVEISGSYDRFEGSYEILITPAGEVAVLADFEYAGDDLWVRETGLRLSVPKSADLLRWQRRSEWSVYPPDHIGRPAGGARAAAQHSAELPPTWAWAQDNASMGSNDFRATKRNIVWAALGYPAGPAVLVLADGEQHARAALETDRISLHINGWYGGTNAGWQEWEHNYGKGKLLRTGDHVRETVRLRLARF